MDAAELSEHLDQRRSRLGISKTLLAKRAGLSLATVNRLLSAEGMRPGIDSVSALAEALGLEVVLGARHHVRAVENVVAFRERRARVKARRLVGIVQASMALEADGVSTGVLREMEEKTVHELLAGPGRRLWSD